MSYSGIYFGVKFIQHIYDPSKLEEWVKTLPEFFGNKYNIGDKVRYRSPHRKSKCGVITDIAYTTYGSYGGRCDGGTVKVYNINNSWQYQGRIKEIIKDETN